MDFDPKTGKPIPWWDGRSQLPDKNMSFLGLLWELAKTLIPIIVFGLMALSFTNGKSCDMPKGKPTSQEQQQQRERDNFFKKH